MTAWIKRQGGINNLKYKLDQVGLWKIRGEDPNCDFGGPHHMPELGYVEGTYEKAIMWATIQPNWSSWGAGGDVTLVTNVTKV